jgi:hypothetical protein
MNCGKNPGHYLSQGESRQTIFTISAVARVARSRLGWVPRLRQARVSEAAAGCQAIGQNEFDGSAPRAFPLY